MVSASVRRQQIAYVCQRGRSVRRACALLSVARSTVGYESRVGATRCASRGGDAGAGGAVPAVRLSAHPGLPGAPRACDEPGSGSSTLAPASAASAEKAAAAACGELRPRPLPATAMGQVWAYDFVFDACANGQQLKCLTVVDEFTRECLAIDVAGSIRSGRVIEVLSKLVSVHGSPQHLRSDNGPEFVSRAVLKWLAAGQHRYRAYRSRKAMAERHQRIFQRQVPRRMPSDGVVQKQNRCEDRDRAVPAPVQRGSDLIRVSGN